MTIDVAYNYPKIVIVRKARIAKGTVINIEHTATSNNFNSQKMRPT